MTPVIYHPPAAGPLLVSWHDLATLCERSDVEQAQAAARGEQARFFLWHDGQRLLLNRVGDRKGVYVPGAEIFRRASGRSELARACGVTRGQPVRVLDPMAGLGIDGLTLAAMGCEVSCIERQPMSHLLLVDLARRCGLEAVRIVLGEAWEQLATALPADVIYLDPMFPARTKTASPGKRLQYLAELAQPDSRGVGEWLARAREAAGQRVVLKRRLQDPEIALPHWQIKGRAVRYDVYRPL